MAKQRADVLLVARGLVESRARAQALIMAGLVFSGTVRIAKAGDMLSEDRELSVKGQEHPWVSRGGVKLAHGLEYFGLDPQGRICLDVGASTGGFTDVLLHHGAAHVHAVDVGHGQLAWKLRQDPRVTVYEKTNARHLTPQVISEPIGALVCDASFIGLQIVLPAGLALCAQGAFAVALIKPQFEAGPEHVVPLISLAAAKGRYNARLPPEDLKRTFHARATTARAVQFPGGQMRVCGERDCDEQILPMAFMRLEERGEPSLVEHLQPKI